MEALSFELYLTIFWVAMVMESCGHPIAHLQFKLWIHEN